MMRHLRLFVPLLIFIITGMFLWQGLKQNPHLVPSPLIDKPFPVFRMPSLNASEPMVSNKNFKGHVTLLNVFATWCLSCRIEHPILMDIAEREGVTLVGLDYKDKREAALSWLKKYGNPYSAIIDDPQGELAINLGVYGTPESFVIDENGIIRYKYTGPIDARVWDEVLEPVVRHYSAESFSKEVTR